MLYLAAKLTVADQVFGFIRIGQPLTVVKDRVSTARQTLLLATLPYSLAPFSLDGYLPDQYRRPLVKYKEYLY